MDVIKLARGLMQVPSPSGEERRIGEFLVKRLERNFCVKKQKVGKRFNILATKGAPRLLLSTHMDTVPSQLEVREDAEFIYGRGACDAKGVMASMICAAEQAAESGYRDFGLLFDVGEEDDFSGIRKAVRLVHPELVILGEPTDFKVVVGQKGLLGITIVCRGRSAHGATLEKGVSAINQLIDVLGKLRALRLPKDPVMGETTLNIGKLNGGSSPNVVAAQAEAGIELRTTTLNKIVLALLETCIPRQNIIIECSYEPVLAKGVLVPLLDNYEKIIVPYFTELYFWQEKAKAVVFGPGNLNYAHTGKERIRKTDLEKAAQIFAGLVRNYSRHP
ncbi:MAG: M20/M25/M40 family metallo-hydrolase [Nanoarchaeota archaeon]